MYVIKYKANKGVVVVVVLDNRIKKNHQSANLERN